MHSCRRLRLCRHIPHTASQACNYLFLSFNMLRTTQGKLIQGILQEARSDVSLLPHSAA